MTNPAITHSAVSRRHTLATSAERRAIARHQAALAALDADDRTNALIDAIRVEHTGQTMTEAVEQIRTRGPQAPANPAQSYVLAMARPWPAVTFALMTLVFIAGVALGRVL